LSNFHSTDASEMICHFRPVISLTYIISSEMLASEKVIKAIKATQTQINNQAMSYKTRDGARCLKDGAHKKLDLPKAFHKLRTHKFGGESGGSLLSRKK